MSSPELSKSDNPPAMKPIAEMSDREIAEETLYWMRFAGQVLTQMQNGGVGKMMMSMMGARK